MNDIINRLLEAQKKAMAERPKTCGFPYLAEVFRKYGIKKNIWSLPSCQSIYVFDEGSVVQQGIPIFTGIDVVASFDKDALINAIRTDQAGKSTFPEFLLSTWKAGVTWYEVDFEKRIVTYGNSIGETYIESYDAVYIKN